MCFTMGDTSETWLGTSLSDLYQGEGPWAFSTPPLSPSSYHHVLFKQPITLSEPPEPFCDSKPSNSEDYVVLPYSPDSLYLVVQDGKEIIRQRWEVICESLLKPINTLEELEIAMNSYNNNKLWKFTALQHFFNNVLQEDESKFFFTEILPNIIQLALRLPEYLPGSVPLLKQNHCRSVSLSQLQISSLLANAFLCTFIWKKNLTENYPSINFVRLFSANRKSYPQEHVMEKIKCLLHYFRRVTDKEPVGVVTFERKFTPKNHMPRWDTLDNNLGNTKIHVTSSGTIEDSTGLLQVDFANKFIGGGVLGSGCVQEEIRFVICPELIVSRLFTEVLTNHEALVVMGIERYSDYSGYSDGFKWEGNYQDDRVPYDDFGRKKTSVCAIDAIRFNKNKDQFHCSAILRELNKAYSGFVSREKSNMAPVATGNWGCGAFRGDAHLKSLIQLMACSATGRNMVYYSFGDVTLKNDIYNMYLFLANNQVTVCQLWRYLCRFCAAGLAAEKLYSFVQQCHFDLKSQPTVKQFLSLNIKKVCNNTSRASTSSDSASLLPEKKKKTDSFEDKSSETQNFVNESKVNSKKTVMKESKEEIEDNSDKILNIIGMIDGEMKTSCENDEDNETFLDKIDKLRKEKPQFEKHDDVAIEMEIDLDESVEEIGKEAKSSLLSEIQNKEDKKKKITDYFTKTTSRS